MTKTSREDIIKEAAALFMRNGYVGTSLSDISQEVGIQKASLFFYFKNKEDLYLNVIENYVIGVQSPLQKFGDCEGLSLLEFIELYLEKVEQAMCFLHSVIKGGNLTAVQYMIFILESGKRNRRSANAILSFDKEEVDLWERQIKQAQAQKEIRSDIESRNIAEIFRYTYAGISYMFSLNDGVTVAQVRHMLYSIYNTVKCN